METPLESPPAAVAPGKPEERRHRSRTPLKIILVALFITTALWVFDLYTRPSWDKIISFLQGYFFGSFVMAWILQRADRMSE
jgi:uncharacterized membrane protein YedE/YeeE